LQCADDCPRGAKALFCGRSDQGGCFIIERARAAITCICEGLATGLALYQCVGNSRVVVAFDAGNLVHAAGQLQQSGMCSIRPCMARAWRLPRCT